jgi:ATP-dependent helicase/nuclease subunit A
MSILTPHQKSALDFNDHLSLTANAGSGKTFVLARRYLNAALTHGISLHNIAAITFTDKAAGELYNKIVKLVVEQIRQTGSNEEKIKLEQIRRQLVSANISTIHSFCINILREYPVEAGLDARFVPIDEQLSDELIELSIEETD